MTDQVKRIVCLANSRRPGGRCVAGKEVLLNGEPGLWIRPVSDREEGGVSEYERHYENGSEPRLLDVIDVPMLEPKPEAYQQENWLLDPDYYWERVKRLTPKDLGPFIDKCDLLWKNGDSSSTGFNNRVGLGVANTFGYSLLFIRVDNLSLRVSQPGLEQGKAKRDLDGAFKYHGYNYTLRVTDPDYEKRYKKLGNGVYAVGDAFLTVSLGEPFHGHAYKLIAAIITP